MVILDVQTFLIFFESCVWRIATYDLFMLSFNKLYYSIHIF